MSAGASAGSCPAPTARRTWRKPQRRCGNPYGCCGRMESCLGESDSFAAGASGARRKQQSSQFRRDALIGIASSGLTVLPDSGAAVLTEGTAAFSGWLSGAVTPLETTCRGYSRPGPVDRPLDDGCYGKGFVHSAWLDVFANQNGAGEELSGPSLRASRDGRRCPLESGAEGQRFFFARPR